MSHHDTAADDWVGGPEADADRQRLAWLQSTPAQRLEWLEQAIAFAYQAGALPPTTAPIPSSGATQPSSS